MSAVRHRLAVAAVLLGAVPGRAAAQAVQPPSGTVRVDSATLSAVPKSDPANGVVELKPGSFETAGGLTVGPWTLTTKTAWSTRDPQRQISARLGYATKGGLRVSAGITGRQRYVMPLVVAQPLGSDSLAVDAGASFFAPADRAMLWDTQIRVEKTLKDAGRLRIHPIGELFNLLDSSTLFGGSKSPLTSRSLRVGLKLGY
jgi:hypothetical protein